MKKIRLWAIAAMMAVGTPTATLIAEAPRATPMWDNFSGLALQHMEHEDIAYALAALGVDGEIIITESGVIVDNLRIDVERFFSVLGDSELLEVAHRLPQCCSLHCGLTIDCEQGCWIGSQMLAARGAAAAARLPHPALIAVGEAVVAYLTYHLTAACLECCERNGGDGYGCRREIMDEARNIADRLYAKVVRYLEEGVIDPGPLQVGRGGMGMPLLVP